jgi:hypothetical protein
MRLFSCVSDPIQRRLRRIADAMGLGFAPEPKNCT